MTCVGLCHLILVLTGLRWTDAGQARLRDDHAKLTYLFLRRFDNVHKLCEIIWSRKENMRFA